jgi:hypothetical protein
MRAFILAGVFALIGSQGLAAQAYQPVDFNKLSSFDYELPDPFDPAPAPINNVIPDAVKALDGKLVAIEGFMLPLDLNPQGVTTFMLNASIDMCYFGAPVRMNEWVLVTMKGGKRAAFTHLATTVKGKLSVGEQIRNGRVGSLYRLEADVAEVDGRR